MLENNLNYSDLNYWLNNKFYFYYYPQKYWLMLDFALNLKRDRLEDLVSAGRLLLLKHYYILY